ncbi:hypothetical protein LAZ67_3001396 [Cordylochernes scorpioides]|uniref:Mos1 transposase HTH domain-containing protein n=1 Tax=Cordylochernes scorpioides TaxID=51811 RepID=A0ABY6K7M9_9ARAC|nr:hypothetical protein LAZ67_3001396 [Cordylochernes scorpioides]
MLAKVCQQRKIATSGRQRSTKGNNRMGGQSNCQNGCRSTGIHVIYHPTCDRHTSVQNDHQQATERVESKSTPTVTMPTPHTRGPTSPTTVVSGAINWGRIVFSDESRFFLCPDDRRKRVWRRPGQRADHGLTVEHHTGPQQGFMVWGAISFASRTPFVVIPGTLTPQRYKHIRGVLDRLRFLPIKKMDQRTCIKFCVKNEIKCADAFRMLTVAYGEATLDRSNVYRWYKIFSEGREDVNDEERAGRPSTSTTDEKINEVKKIILANRRITVREVAEDLNILNKIVQLRPKTASQ